LLLETLNERSVRGSGLFSWAPVKEALHAHFERRANLGYHLWGLLVLFLWMKHWGIEPPSQSTEAPEIPEFISVRS
jgi:asparagine synthase (glutamine-hydrolysing)